MRVLTDHSARLGIDVGGTFTDFVLADPRSNQLITHKEPSTPDDPSLAVEQGLASLLDQSAFTSNIGKPHLKIVGLTRISHVRPSSDNGLRQAVTLFINSFQGFAFHCRKFLFDLLNNAVTTV